MASFAKSVLTNLPTGTHTCKISNVSPPKTGQNGNLRIAVQFKDAEGRSAFQYCNCGADEFAIEGNGDDAVVSLPQNTRIFLDNMEAAGFTNNLNPDDIIQALTHDDDEVRTIVVADLIGDALKAFIGLEVTVKVQNQSMKMGSRSVVQSIVNTQVPTDGVDEDSFDSID